MPRSRSLAAILLCLSLLAIAGRSPAQGCEPDWAQDQFCFPGIDGTAYASCVYDDGTGEALYVGGEFDIAGCHLGLNNIVKWDGHTWSPLTGSGGTGIDGTVRAMAVYDDGSGPALYVGGEFTTVGSLTANNIAKWDGKEWSTLAGANGVGTDDRVSALCTFDDGSGLKLYVGGGFVKAGDIEVNHVATWDGNEWNALVSAGFIGVNGDVFALATHTDTLGEALYVGGSFNEAGDTEARFIARWQNSDWSALTSPSGAGLSGSPFGYGVLSLVTYDDGTGPALMASGEINGFVQRWDGTEWNRLTGPSGESISCGLQVPVVAMSVYDDGTGDVLYVGGGVSAAGGDYALSIARWDGIEWSGVGSSFPAGFNGYTYSLSVFDDGSGAKLYAAGSIAGGLYDAKSRGISSWNGADWCPVFEDNATHGIDFLTSSIQVFDEGSGQVMFMSGWFDSVDGISVESIARWDGSSWASCFLSTGVWEGFSLHKLFRADLGDGTQYYAAGGFRSGQGNWNGVARWDGQAWIPLVNSSGVGIANGVCDMALFDDGNGESLYACGSFDVASGQVVNGIAKWTGTAWTPLEGLSGIGLGTSSSFAYSLEVFDDGTGPSLYVGGTFLTAGGMPASCIVRWDGSEWHALEGPSGQGVNGYVYELVKYDGGTGPALLVGGGFSVAGGVPASRLAKWDGNEWSPLVNEPDQELNETVLAIHVDDTNPVEPVIYVGGKFTMIGGTTVNRIAKWDGKWSALSGPEGIGVDGHVTDIELFDDGFGPALYVIGGFTTAGGSVSAHIAKYDLCASPVCLPDTNHDGILSPADFTAWVAAFNTMLPACDQNGDGSCTPGDFTAWLANFNAGCP